jgi:hypothetical protein
MSDDDHDPDGYGYQDALPPPDWNRVLVHSRAMGGPVKPVGDPTRWGGAQDIVLQAALVRQSSDQFLRAQTSDNYGRLWALCGNVTTSPVVWALGLTWTLFLEVTQGSGQAVVTQLFDLRLLTASGLAVYGVGTPGLVESRSFAIIGGVIGQQWSARLVWAIGDPAVNGINVNVSVIAAVMAAGTGL